MARPQGQWPTVRRRREKLAQQRGEGGMERHPGAGDGRRAGAAVGLDHIAIHCNLTFTQGDAINTSPQRPSDQALDFNCTTALLARSCFAAHPGVRGAGQHAIFGRYPPFAFAAQEGGHPFLHRCGN